MEETKGLYIKYDVRKVETGEKVNDCFVLRPDKDPAAATALRAYALVTPNKALANDIMAWVGAKPVDKPRLAEVLGVEEHEQIRVKSIKSAEFNTKPFSVFEVMDGSKSWAWEAVIYAINHPESIIRVPCLTKAELERCRVYGIRYLAREKGSEYVTLHFEKPRELKPGYFTCGECVGNIDATFFPSVKPGECVGPVEFEGLGKKDG